MNPKEQFILRKLRLLARFNPRDEAAVRALARAKSQLSDVPTEPAMPLGVFLGKEPKIRSKHMVSRMATLVLGGAAVIAIILALSIHDGPGQIAFAQVIENIRQTQSLVFMVKFNGEEGKPEEQRIIILPEGKMRSEGSAGYAIQDYQNHKMMMVNSKSKTAIIIDGYAPPFPEMAKLNPYEMIRNIVRKNDPQRLPDEEIGGRKAAVFMVEYKMPPTDEKVPTKVWVDLATDLPFRMEMTGEESPGKKAKTLMHDMVFDQPVDPALFNFTPPAGYTVQTTGTAQLPALPKKPELSAPEIIPGVGLGPVRFRMSREEIEKHFGKPDRYDENNTRMIYYSRGFDLGVSHRKGLLFIQCLSQKGNLFQVREFMGKTKEGIGIGSRLEDVEKVFGKPDRDEGHDPMNKSLIYAKLGLDVQFFQDKVVKIFMGEVRSPTDTSSPKKGILPKEEIHKTAGKSLRINIVGPDGKPMSGVKIHAAIWAKEPAKTNRDYFSDARGKTVVDYPQNFNILRLFVFHEGYVPLFIHWEKMDESPPDAYTVKLAKGTLIGGLVKNEEGQPIAGAKVEVMLVQNPNDHLKRTSITSWLAEGDDARITDSQGRWTLNNVPEGNVQLLLKFNHSNYRGDREWGGLQKEQGITLKELRDQRSILILQREK